MAKSSGTLRRYTNVLSLLDILKRKRLTLLNPATWYDQNDTLGLRRYADLKGAGKAYALCFAEGSEQAHHWQIFAADSHGVAIIFDKKRLLASFDSYEYKSDVIHGPVQYRSLTEMKEMGAIKANELPFLKRDTFKAEEEYRIVAWEDDVLDIGHYPIPIDAGSIAHVLYGPTMPEPLAQNLKEIVSTIENCEHITFSKSRIVNNASWEKAISHGLAKRQS